jgi:hypothetical protein
MSPEKVIVILIYPFHSIISINVEFVKILPPRWGEVLKKLLPGACCAAPPAMRF